MTSKLHVGAVVTFVATQIYLISSLTFGAPGYYNYCPIKIGTGYPCLFCGSTRSLMAAVTGDLQLALHYNPLGVLIYLVICILGLIAISDWILHTNHLTGIAKKVENALYHPLVIGILLFIVGLNWFWSISKGL